VDGDTTEFVYNGSSYRVLRNGSLVKKTNPDDSYVLYIGAVMEVEKNSGGTVLHTTIYYPAGGAVRVDNTLSYVLGDQLGSASAVLDSAGNKTAETRYYPFGETCVSTGSMPTDRLFTGQRLQSDLGIYHFGARFYDPLLGCFLSADTMLPYPSNSQSYDRFAFVLNNPMIFVDPSGHVVVEQCSYPVLEEGDQCVPPGSGDDDGSSTPGDNDGVPRYQDIIISLLPKLGMPFTNENGLCINWRNIVCSGGEEYRNWWINEYYPMWPLYIHDDLTQISMVLQDGATVADLIGMGVVQTGAILGGEPGYLAALTFYLTYINSAETILSSASTAFTLADDIFVTHSSHIEDGELVIDETTSTSLLTTFTGNNIPLPAVDFAIDAYMSGYNHGIVPWSAPDLINWLFNSYW
jgi:RHS repeat-associated protein